ncbi:MAG: aldo/keto reductase [Treponema sp.]|jgi:aryl-alcohol dehydrogenase-like predicted oxidoreductase|nr:aldo/keto reductase [Treponema sp.]
MQYRSLSPGGPEVSNLCLGTAQFGARLSPEEAFKQMDYFFDHGGTFLDTARIYCAWVPGGLGASEGIIGAWLRERKVRNRIIISSKGGHPDLNAMDIPRLGPAEVRADLEESLKDLGTDHIDFYFLHRDDPSVPVEEILDMLETFKKEGKIGFYGCSNWDLSRITEADRAAARRGFEGFVCNQIRWGLGDINLGAVSDKTLVVMDKPIYDYHRKTKKAAMAYTSSCNGYFSKKLRGRPLSPPVEGVYGNGPNTRLLEMLGAWEKEFRLSAAALVSAYVMAQDFPAVPISSFSSIAQMEELFPGADFTFPPECLEEIGRIKQFVL